MAGELEPGATAPLAAELRELQGLADSFGRAMTTAFRRSVIDGRALEDVLRSIALSMSSRALNQALAPIGQGIGSLILGGVGNAFSGARSAGVGGARAASGVNVVFNVTTPDTQSFKRAEAEVSAMLARAVARGQRGL